MKTRGVILRATKAVANVVALYFTLSCGAYCQEINGSRNECLALQNASSPDLVQFLSGVVPEEKNGDCVTWAINKLGNEHYEPGITALVRLLDFRRPPTPREKQGIYMRVQGISEVYPAAGALSLIGQKALPEILRTIEADPTSPTARENALFVWMETYRQTDEHPKAIAILKREETQTNDEKIKQRLNWAAQRAIAWCNPPEEKACRQAAEPKAP